MSSCSVPLALSNYYIFALEHCRNNNSDVPAELDGKYYPHYLPGGYEIKNTFITNIGVEISYINNI